MGLRCCSRIRGPRTFTSSRFVASLANESFFLSLEEGQLKYDSPKAHNRLASASFTKKSAEPETAYGFDSTVTLARRARGNR